MITIPVGYHSARHETDNAIHRNPACGHARTIYHRCSCSSWTSRFKCKRCFGRKATTHWGQVKHVLSKIRELLRTPFNDSRVETFIGRLGIGSLTESTALLKRCEKAGLVEIDYDQDDYRPRVKDLTVRGRELLPALEANIDRFDGWELEDLQA